MKLEIIEEENSSIMLKISLENKDSFLETEEEIMRTVNHLGRVLTKKSLENLDINDKIININNTTLSFKGKKKRV
jgi:hypothetical protein